MMRDLGKGICTYGHKSRLTWMGQSLIFLLFAIALTFTSVMDVDCAMRKALICCCSEGDSVQNYGMQPDTCLHCTSVFPETTYQVMPARSSMVLASSAPFVKIFRASQLLRPPIDASLNQTA